MPYDGRMDILKKALEPRGSLKAVSRELGVTPTTVAEWRDLERPVPPRHCARLASLLNIDRRELRPADWGDIWPELIDAEHPWPPVADEAQGAA